MLNKVRVGRNTEAFASEKEFPPIDRVILWTGDDNYVRAPNVSDYVWDRMTGRIIEADCPYADQYMANRLLDKFSSFVYKPFNARNVEVNPAAELGDGIQINGLYSILASQDYSFNSLGLSDVKAKGDNELDHEYPYIDPLVRKFSNKISGLSTSLSVLDGKIEGKISKGEAESLISQSLDSLTLSITNKGLTSSIQLKSNGVVISGGSIDLSGAVTFSDLTGYGKTNINGSNITTGTISAERINLSGSVDWSDLSSQCRAYIMNELSELPEYIHNTYIDSVRIVSPKIYGGEIYAGTQADGYIKLTGNGLNFISKQKGNLIGLGYHAGNYNYPYIVFGDGVDAVGTDRALIKKYANGLWLGDSDGISSSSVGFGTGIFINFSQNKIYKYIDGVATQL